MAEVPLPEAPPLHEGELWLDVFTHRSLRQERESDQKLNDNERYAALGEKVFEAAVTYCIFKRFPHYTKEAIAQEREKLLTDGSFEKWTNYYQFRQRLRHHPSAMSAIHTPEGAREVFHAYVGGVYTQDNGSMAVNAWAYNLIVPPESRPKEEENIYPPPPSVPYPMAPPPPPLPPPSVPYHSRGRTSSMSSGRKVPVLADDANGYADGYNTTSPNKVAYLPRFNEFCTQRRVSVQYNAEQGGLQHAPRWIVKCMVNGELRGEGTATTKQLAKEEAAKQAWTAMGLVIY